MSSRFGSLKAMLDDARAKGDTLFGRIKDRATFRRTVYACYLIGRADGNFDASERQAIGALIQQKLPQFKLEDIMKEIEGADAKLAFDETMGTQELMAEIGKATGDAAELIVQAACYIGAADGEFDDAEKAIARQIAERMNLAPGNYGLA